ncbi:type II toxin-antitoxin system Phd/YefM family antitoxin [Ponticoccus sp. SC2-23]|uniref:type II toxin-antitoxin system prevent-host-death family antitoxin n=1 Tax=Alexandriicola marinus TaxID=2081710 RepID=UPI000FD9F7E5|nr:type II toxin-antitoxin system prevent-host-death family antitoxin [Alexandriicola marinus]MBM1222920.1 type II toxin-antitoxin system Phd/YefM family antitoxin [Ponticoccus sp. SC6-9]MBM1227347.1 type II toxin-antitoxin system Phd/YefM family antitoxin [Ponticoccus sp. SC6-15]MBM1231850.1 type II toxin-antitoxin system Phd/YefM family antitoxin [Ponticoccus sp. SC6-38]MBM1236380.1 type II toxin-antitoxin system Phd/YefM family antitoxin [Ponticoccus sp. SC6-45]MBM1240868.1 type II toxin-an
MARVTATEFRNNIGIFSDAAMNEPVIITSHDRDRLVLLSADEYRRLTGSPGGLSDDRKRELSAGIDYHAATIMELAKR